MWYHSNGIANILSLAQLRGRSYHVMYDSNNGHGFKVHKADGMVRLFKQSTRGLFYMESTGDTEGVTLVNTVADNCSSYTNHDYSCAVLARKLQKIIGQPSTHTFLTIVEKNLLPNCPITRKDILAAEAMFGRNVGSLKGKTVWQKPTRVEGFSVDIPSSITSRYRSIVLASDIMFVNKIPFFMSISRHIKFGTAEMLQNKNNNTILTAIKQIKSIYMRHGFVISTLLMDGQFESLRGNLAELQISLNTVSNNKHVPDIERHIRTTKERARCVYNTLPFKQMPARMVTEMIYLSTFWLNSFLPSNGISTTLSPCAIVVGTQLDYTKHCQLEFGTYIQTHEDHDNSMATWTTGAIALQPTGNEQGSYYFFSLTSGQVLNCNCWTALPMPAEVIDQVHVLAHRTNSGLTFSDSHGNPFISNNDIEHDSDDESYHPDENDNIDSNIDLDNHTNNNDPNMGHPNNPNVNIAGVCETKYKG